MKSNQVKYRIVRIDDGFYIQKYSRKWFRWDWRNEKFYNLLFDGWSDYFPSYEDAKEILDKILNPSQTKVLYEKTAKKCCSNNC